MPVEQLLISCLLGGYCLYPLDLVQKKQYTCQMEGGHNAQLLRLNARNTECDITCDIGAPHT